MNPANGSSNDLHADDAVSTAFTLGWETALLYFGSSFDSARGEEQESDGLPGLISLPPPDRTKIAINLIEAKLDRLEPRLTEVAQFDRAPIERLRQVVGGEAEQGGQRKGVVKELHYGVVRALTTAELRLGRAYGLGHALAETWLLPTDRESFRKAFGVRLIAIKDWLADLSSSFPLHASRAVVLSLRAWEKWAANPEIRKKPLVWDKHGPAVRESLQRQGELWRDLLAGDKSGEDMLDTEHYLLAAHSLIGRMAVTMGNFMRRLVTPLLIAALALPAGIAIVLVVTDTAGKVVGLLLTAVGAVGITGASVRARIGKVAGELQARLWGAELDQAIAEAVLIGPDGWEATVKEVAVPPTGTDPKVAENMTVIETLRATVESGRRRQLRKLLAARDLEFQPLGQEPLRKRDDVVRYLLDMADKDGFTAEPDKVEAVPTGALITHRDGVAEVWRVQEKRVRHWTTCESAEQARAVAEEIVV